jgi:threonine aldolase
MPSIIMSSAYANARRLADGLNGVRGIEVVTNDPATNTVFFDPAATGLSPESFLAELLSRGVRMGHVRGVIRAVTHLDVSRADIDATILAIRAIVQAPQTSFVPVERDARGHGH